MRRPGVRIPSRPPSFKTTSSVPNSSYRGTLGLISLPDSFRYLVIHPERHCLSATSSVNTSRLLVTYLDRDMDFVWTLKHLDKTSWQRGSSVQIKPLQSIVLSCERVPGTLQPSEFLGTRWGLTTRGKRAYSLS